MKLNNGKFIAKGLLLTIIGIILIFFPKIITYTLYGICIIIGLFCIVEIIQGITSGDAGVVIPSVIGSAVLIAVVIFIPKIVTFGIGFIGGIVIAVFGITEIVKAINSEKGLIRGIIGAITLIAGGICVFNPFHAASLARILIGAVMVLLGIFNLYVARVMASRNGTSSSGIIDIKDFTTKK